MRMLGLILVIVGAICLMVPSITFWTQDTVANTPWVDINVQRPHTIVLNPVVGIIALIAGAAMLMMPRKETL